MESLGGIGLDYVDAIVIVDENGRIVYSIRYNPRFDKCGDEKEFNSIINRNVLDVYPTVDPQESTIMNCLKKGVPIAAKGQTFCDYKGTFLKTDNLTIPIINKGKVLGAIELSKDITSISDVKSRSRGRPDPLKPDRQVKGSRDSLIRFSFDDIITQNKEMQRCINNCRLIANSTSPILIYGETGTGKELFVQSIHSCSSRKDGPFIAQNCAALPETLFEGLLFGTAKGAFTGADDRQGLFEAANGGTLFLDEINSMPLNLQAKLLRVLQDGYIKRIGDVKDRRVEVRVIAAMNLEPLEAIRSKQLREDLFYRLNALGVRLPPLRERKDDIMLLAKCFINEYNTSFGKDVKGLTRQVEFFFLDYEWPGNVRELQHVIEAAISMIDGQEIDICHLPIYLNKDINPKGGGSNGSDRDTGAHGSPLHDAVEMVERNIIIDALESVKWNVSRASKLLNLPRQTLQYKINKYGINLK